MKKYVNYIKFILAAGFLSLLVCQRYLNNVIIYAHDLGYHLNRITQISEGISSGRFPILIHTGLLHGLGYANPLFYPELFLYIPAIMMSFMHLHALTAYKLFLIIISFFTFSSMYYVTKKVYGKKEIAYLSGILYTFSLYRLTDIYVRGALGEVIAFVFVPLLIYGLYNVIFESGKKWYMICFGLWGIINCHVLSFIIMIPIVLLICLFNIDIIFKNKKIFAKLLIAGCISVLLSIGFVGPMLEQKSLGIYKVDVKTEDAAKLVYDKANSIGMTLSNSIKVGHAIDPSVRDDGLSGGIGFILIALAGLIIFRKDIDLKNKESRRARFEIQSSIIGLIILIMTTKLFPWNRFEFMSVIQFPFRLNIIPITMFAIVGAKNFYELFGDEESKKNACVIFSIMMVIFSGYMISNTIINAKPEKVSCFDDLMKMQVGSAEYLPVTADEKSDDWTLYNINEKSVSIPFEQNGNTIEFEYSNNEKDFEVNIPLIYYKGYVAHIVDENGNTSVLDVVHNEENGHVLIKGDKSLHGKVVVKYKMTAIQKVCYFISFATIVLMVFWVVREKLRIKRLPDVSKTTESQK